MTLIILALTGALAAMGKAGEPPTVPLNLIGDYGGGSLFLLAGMLAALLKAEKTGQGDVVDAAMIDGVSSMMTLFYTLAGLGQWSPKRESNLLDGAMPYYRCYETLDGRYMAVGCIEPQFFAQMLTLLELKPSEFGGQKDPKKYQEQIDTLTALFKTKTQKEWEGLFADTDACVTPVLDYQEAASHPQNAARGGMTQMGPFLHPRKAPLFKETDATAHAPILGLNDSANEILSELGYDKPQIQALKDKKVIGVS